jgi:hypothetical protein
LALDGFNFYVKFYFRTIISLCLELPTEVTEALAKISSLVQSTIKPLEESIAKAKVIQEKIKELESSAFNLSQEEVDKMKKVSSKKIEDAISLHNSIEKIKKESGYLTKAEAENLSTLMELSKSKLPLN